MKPTVSQKNMHVIIGSSSSRDPKFGMFFSWESPPPQLWVPAAQTFGCPSHARRYRGGLSPFLYLLAVLHKKQRGTPRMCNPISFNLEILKSGDKPEDFLEKNHQKITYAKSPNLPSLPKWTVVLIHKPDLSLHSWEGEPAFPWRGWQSPQEPSLYLPSYYLTVTTTCSSSSSRIQCCWKRAVTQIYTPEM